VDLIGDEKKHLSVEFKLAGHQVPYLVNAVKELNENRTPIIKIRLAIMPTPSSKHMTER
jgi:hypothetical protein